MKTAVEWLVEELEDNGINLDLAFELIEQAKEMEKEQIEDAYDAGFGSMDDVKDRMYKQYYNKTYGGDE
jgi:hypothetical protein